VRRLLVTTTVLLLAAGFLRAQFTSGVLVVNVVATVVDGKGRTVPNLTGDDFIVEEDGQPQTIKHILPTADVPVSIGVVLDASGSMQSKMRTAQRAIGGFFSAIHKDDEIFLMTFANRASIVADFTSDRAKLTNALLSGVNLSGGTSLYDSLYQALEKVKQGRYEKKAILLVTDGEDTSSLTRFDKALENIREADMLVYSIGIKGAPVFDVAADSGSGGATASALSNTTVDMKVLNRFGEASGGKAWEISEPGRGARHDCGRAPQPIQHRLLPGSRAERRQVASRHDPHEESCLHRARPQGISRAVSRCVCRQAARRCAPRSAAARPEHRLQLGAGEAGHEGRNGTEGDYAAQDPG
jgi:VWFA-related protein